MAKSVLEAPGAGNSKRVVLEAGSYGARLVQVIELGLQAQEYQGEQKDPRHEVMLTYEFGDEFMHDEDGQELEDKPRWLSESFAVHNLQADRAKSTARYKVFDPALAGKGLFSDYLGTPVSLIVVVNPSKKDPTKVYENVASVSPMRAKEAERAPELKNEPRYFDIDNPDLEIFLALPKWVQEKVKGNLEFEGSALSRLLSEGGAPAKDSEDNSSAADAASNAADTDDNPY